MASLETFGQIYTLLVLAVFIFIKVRSLKNGDSNLTRLPNRVLTIDTFIWIVILLQGVTFYLSLTSQDLVQSSNAVEGVITQFIGNVLAIFFSLAIVPISNIATNTSHAFIERVTKNRVFVYGILLYSVIFISVYIQGTHGTNQAIAIINSTYLLFALITFVILIAEVLRLMDIKNVIKDFEAQTIYSLEKRWKNITNQAKDLNKQLILMASIKNSLIYETKVKIEPIFVTTKRYIALDHYDIVATGLESIAHIAFKYIDLFKFSIQDNDGLITYLIERFQDLKGAITDTSHYSILPNLVSAIRSLALKSLEIETPLSKHHQSYLQLGLINSLRDYIVSKDILKDTTSSPLDAVNAITDFAIAAIDRKYLHMSLSALDLLSDISSSCTKLNFFYANRVALESNQSIMKIHYHMLLKLHQSSHFAFLIRSSITKPIEAYIDIGEDSPQKDNLSPFFGTGLDPITVTDPYSIRQLNNLAYVIFLLLTNSDDVTLEAAIIDYVEEMLSEINQLLMKAGKKRMFFLTREIVDTAYGIAFTLLQFVELGKLKDKASIKKLFDERLFFIFSNGFSYEFTIDNSRWLNDKLDKWYSVLGLYLLTFQSWDGFPMQTVDKSMDEITKALPKMTDLFQGKEYINHTVAHDIKDVMSYLNLCLHWQQNLLNNKSLETTLVRFIITNQEKLSRWESGKRFPTTFSSIHSDNWTLDQPFVAYNSQYLWDSKDLLEPSDNDSYYFDSFMKFQETKWQLIQDLKRYSQGY